MIVLVERNGDLITPFSVVLLSKIRGHDADIDIIGGVHGQRNRALHEWYFLQIRIALIVVAEGWTLDFARC